MAIIGIDYDGVILYQEEWYKKPKINKKFLEIIKEKSKSHKIEIISNRPKLIKWLTIRKFYKLGIRIDKIVYVGGTLSRIRAERKWRTIKKEKIDLFIDNSKTIRDYIFQRGIACFSPEQIINFYGR